jgi:hypothetical protein
VLAGAPNAESGTAALKKRERPVRVDTVEKVDAERIARNFRSMWVDNALNLLMLKIAHSQIFLTEESKTDFFNSIGRVQPFKQ